MMPSQPPIHPEAATSLMLAVIASSSAPLLLLDADARVIAASSSFCRVFAVDPATIENRALEDLGAGEWDVVHLASLLRTVADGTTQVEPYEMDFKREGLGPRRLVLRAQKLDYSDAENVRILLAISDVTDARISEKLKDDMVREKDILLRELQHRVANSLQIIASVLMHSARKVQSEETRAHLHDAHHRVMSIAALQRQLAISNLDDVELRSYFGDLCQSIGASMIRDHNQLSIEVSADATATAADVSISLGLIVTELVINALKHAFPDQRSGRILVDYEAEGPDWTLSVSDDGVGMPDPAEDPHSGLGTTIVEALAKKLDASVRNTDAKPGTRVSIVHTG
jgi:two-component sensor histidine kinase